MISVGITGGIGSGKTVVSKILESLGYPVFNSDDKAKELLNSNEEVKSKLVAWFGNDLYMHGQLDRQRLAQIIFNNEDSRNRVNELIHPLVRAEFEKLSRNSKSPLVFNEAAILFETGAYKNLDKTILVIAPEKMRAERVAKRDGNSAEDVMARINAQWSDEQKKPLADFIIYNDDKTPVLEQVETIVDKLIS